MAEKTEVAKVEQPGTAVAKIKLRLQYPPSLGEYAGIDIRQWQVLVDAVWPSAKTTEAVCLAIAYCRSRNLDPMKRMVHIVPVWSKTGGADGKGGEVETVWPGIAEIRTTATRTGVYAGKDACEFGPDIDREFRHEHDNKIDTAHVVFPEWARITVYKIVQGVRCAFVGPKVYWLESYATKSRWSEVPNEMWADRKSGQLEKCAEAAALRAAFPEEIGGEITAEEMHGRVVDHVPVVDRTSKPQPGTLRAAFARVEDAEIVGETTKPEKKRAKKAAKPPVNATVDNGPAEAETPLARGERLLKGLRTPAEVDDLQTAILEELTDENEAAGWRHVCAERQKALAANG